MMRNKVKTVWEWVLRPFPFFFKVCFGLIIFSFIQCFLALGLAWIWRSVDVNLALTQSFLYQTLELGAMYTVLWAVGLGIFTLIVKLIMEMGFRSKDFRKQRDLWKEERQRQRVLKEATSDETVLSDSLLD